MILAIIAAVVVVLWVLFAVVVARDLVNRRDP